ncbi:MAG: helix-turn-helix domain-containing protein [Betaproteobacteria bacterium]
MHTPNSNQALWACQSNRLTGLHRTYVGSVERGERNVSIDNLERFARALGVALPVLLQD